MKGSDPEFIEAARLMRKFFPESKELIKDDEGITIGRMAMAMQICDIEHDDSLTNRVNPPEGVFADLSGTNDSIFRQLLDRTGFNPSGRIVVVPDALGLGGWSRDNLRPFVCHAPKVFERLGEMPIFMGNMCDSIFTYESGECLALDHDDNFFWAKSRARKWMV